MRRDSLARHRPLHCRSTGSFRWASSTKAGALAVVGDARIGPISHETENGMAKDAITILDVSVDIDAQKIRIIQAALTEFTEKGIQKTRMEDVAIRASIGRATLFRAFSSKNELVRSVVHFECMKAIRKIEQDVQHLKTFRERAMEGFVQVILTSSKHPLFRKLSETEPEVLLPLLTLNSGQLFLSAKKRLSQYVTMVQEEGSLTRQVEADDIAELCLRLVQSFVLTPAGVYQRHSEKQLRAFVENTLDILLKAT
jgi:AcrR family transcriptional regulator